MTPRRGESHVVSDDGGGNVQAKSGGRLLPDRPTVHVSPPKILFPPVCPSFRVQSSLGGRGRHNRGSIAAAPPPLARVSRGPGPASTARGVLSLHLQPSAKTKPPASSTSKNSYAMNDPYAAVDESGSTASKKMNGYPSNSEFFQNSQTQGRSSVEAGTQPQRQSPSIPQQKP